MNEEMITISKEYFTILLEGFNHLNQLKAAGVDNWDGYMGFDEEDSEEDIYG